jgi:hypothetical protein
MNVKIVVFTPLAAADAVRTALAEAGAGHIGNYDFCSFSSRGVGRFRPLDGANPHIGEHGIVEEVEEERIETICPKDILDRVLEKLREAHPYEEPAIDVYPLLEP